MTSVLNVDTIADKAGTGPVGLTKQQAAKFVLTYDAINQTNDNGLNNSSTTDVSTGEFRGNAVSAFATATGQTQCVSAYNAVDDNGDRVVDATRGVSAFPGAHSESSELAFSTSVFVYTTHYGANYNSNGAVYDLAASYVVIFGDLA